MLRTDAVIAKMVSRRSALLAVVWFAGALSGTVAQAGTGPWTLEAGEHNVYIGADYYRYAKFNGGSGAGALQTRVTAAGLTGVWTVGMAPGLEAEAKLAYESVRVNQMDAGVCGGPGKPDDWCAPTSNIGDLGARLKWRVVDESYGPPVSLAISVAARSGETYANQRARLTTLGDGNTDVGAIVAVGRTATLGSAGWYRASLDVAYWYRFANRVDPGIGKVPADEVSAETELLLSLHPRVGVGPSASGFTRLGGVPLDDSADYFDPDLFSSLRATQVKVGGKLALYALDNGPTVSIAVLQTVYAENNPSDTLAISVGVGQWIKPKPSVSPPD